MKQFLVLISIIACNAAAAQVILPMPLNFKKPYQQQTRSIDGRPGINYWQNTASYSIAVTYNPVSRLITGSEEIKYLNNSPDTLYKIVFKLYPNLYKKGSVRNMEVESADLNEGVQLENLVVNGSALSKKNIKISGTNMIVEDVLVLPKEETTFAVSFNYTLNKTSHIRTGEIEEGAAFIAYFFPRIAVYDDLDGWNKNKYLGLEEFYNDFCRFKVSVTVPKNYLVWATGDLQNCHEVLTGTYCERLANAEKNDSSVFIIDEADLQKGGITKNALTNTWKFSADNVTDFVFAISDHYVWNAASRVADKSTGRRTRTDAVFNTKHKDYFDVLHYANSTVQLMRDEFPRWPFPYNHITVFDGLDQMEYPMMINDNPTNTKDEAITLTVHETFHTMFPFYMGINETKYAWMDEGWATLAEWLLAPLIDSTVKDTYGVDKTDSSSGAEGDVPIITLTNSVTGEASFLNAYPKPAFGYLFSKDLLGDSLFYKGLHFYMQQWNGKHPLPPDFFNCMNTGSGKNLNWFWKKWFYEDGFPDLGIKKVINKTAEKQIVIALRGSKPVPVDVTVNFAGGSTKKFHRSIAVWENTNKATISFSSSKKIIKVQLGSLYTPDINKGDNVWEANVD